MNREVYHEGWLIKSPPIKRIWRARWRRRWFTLKQGELPGQYFLEYYSDRNCRKKKGIIDLDQCEQVDAGLRMNNSKHKLPYMFDVKTPTRVYYLAADTDEELKGWVNCICQVCGLQDLSRQGDDRHNFTMDTNLGQSSAAGGSSSQHPITLLNPRAELNVYSMQHQQMNDSSCLTETTDLNNSISERGGGGASSGGDTNHILRSIDNQFDKMSIHNTYQNDDFITLRNADYSNRETLICDAKLTDQNSSSKLNKSNSLKLKKTLENNSIVAKSSIGAGNHTRTKTLDQQKSSTSSKKIPENLKLNPDTLNDILSNDNNNKPSPSLSTCSGPYIPISECYSGSPILPPNNLLNSLDPRFYDTPRNHPINIGLNLTDDDHPYSPKRSNCPIPISGQRPISGQSSPTDSESVFTDDESVSESMQGTLDRHLRPSDSSIENDAIGWTYVQRFSRVPNDIAAKTSDAKAKENAPPPRPPKRANALVLDDIEKTKDTQMSDTENASPAIGPKDATSFIEERYEIPRSHRLPYYLNNSNGPNSGPNSISPKVITSADIAAQSTPHLIADDGGYIVKQNFYTNAAPTKIEGSVFRYDFFEQPSSIDAPAVNRNLKPKLGSMGNVNTSHKNPVYENPRDAMTANEMTTATAQNREGKVSVKSNTLQNPHKPPPLDRKLKPPTPKFDTNSMRRKPNTFSTASFNDNSDDETGSLHGHSQLQFQDRKFHTLKSMSSLNSIGNASMNKQPQEDKLQYLDLDHSDNQFELPTTFNMFEQHSMPVYGAIGGGGGSSSISGTGSNNTLVKTNPNQRHGRSLSSATDCSISSLRNNDKGTVYKTVDFLKTEAFKLTRQNVEMTRASNRLKE